MKLSFRARGIHGAQLWLALRITIAGFLSFVLGHLFGLAHSYWAVITAIIVVQSSVGGSLKAVTDRFVGTVGGSIWGIAVSLAIPQEGLGLLSLALVTALAPLALLAAIKPAYRVAPITAMILLLTPVNAGQGLLFPGIERILEIGLGGAVAMGVALFVVPTRADRAVVAASVRALQEMAELTTLLMSDLGQPVQQAAIQGGHDRIRRAITQVEVAAEEVLRERRNHLSDAPDPEPLCRTLRRLRNDLAGIGRARGEFAKGAQESDLAMSADLAGKEIADLFIALAAALQTRARLPSLDDVFDSIADYGAQASKLQHDSTFGDAAGYAHVLGFVLEQLRRNLSDLVDRINDWSSTTDVRDKRNRAEF